MTPSVTAGLTPNRGPFAPVPRARCEEVRTDIRKTVCVVRASHNIWRCFLRLFPLIRTLPNSVLKVGIESTGHLTTKSLITSTWQCGPKIGFSSEGDPIGSLRREYDFLSLH